MTSAGGRAYCCPRCRGPLRAEAFDPTGAAAESSTDAEPRPGGQADLHLAAYDGWEFDQRLGQIERMLQSSMADACRPSAAGGGRTARFDASHAGPAAWHASQAEKPAQTPKLTLIRPQIASATLTWTTLSLGIMALACGGALLAWSLLGDRSELWNVGIPVALCGQIALLIGLILQLDRLWCDNQETTKKLDRVDRQLRESRLADTLRGTTHGSHAGACRPHIAEDDPCCQLLGDQDSQLDGLESSTGETEGS